MPLSNFDKRPPLKFISVVAGFPHVFNTILDHWNSIVLKDYLDKLILASKTKNQQGFPPEVIQALISLSLLNIQLLEASGKLVEEDPASAFRPSKWTLPKNF